MKKYLAIFSLLFILTGCGDSNDPVEIESFKDQDLLKEEWEEYKTRREEQDAEIWRMVEENTTHTEAWYAKAAQMREQAQKEAEEKSLREIRKAEVERSQQLEERQLEEENQFVFESEPPVDCLEDLREDSDNMVGYDYEDYCVHKASAGNIITIDVRVKEGENQTIFDIPYSGIRHSGILIQVYYNAGPFGKSQWFLLPYTKGIMLMPNSITLPINQWVSDGLTVGGWIRVVILTSGKN